MFNKLSIKLIDFVTALSDLLDLAYPGLAQHQLRTAYISGHLGEKLNLSVADQTDLLVAALLHDIGALTPEEKINIKESEFESLDEHCIKGSLVLKKITKFKSGNRGK